MSLAVTFSINHLSKPPLDGQSPVGWSFDNLKPIPLATEHVLGLFAVLGTIVVAIALGQSSATESAPQDAVEVARKNENLTKTTSLLGLGAMVTSYIYAVGHIASGPAEESVATRVFWALAMVGAGLAIAFIAVHAPRRRSDLSRIVEDSLPALELRQGDLYIDALLRWKEDTNVPMRAPRLLIAALAAVVFPSFWSVAYLRTVNNIYGDPSAENLAESIFSIAFISLVFLWVTMMLTTASFGMWMWGLPFWWSIAMIGLTSAMGVILAGSGSYYWSFAWISILYITCVFWLFLIRIYPSNRKLRTLLIIVSYPVHDLRKYYLASSNSYRKREIERLQAQVQVQVQASPVSGGTRPSDPSRISFD
ncbi:hypothetical protein ACFFIO_07455 [Citricoccus parietis]|uniref:Uncharacterized protein n=1 Tax=Citricoccus parietis TaxID=592307 RepID=A0ABV6F4A7_9MICC